MNFYLFAIQIFTVIRISCFCSTLSFARPIVKVFFSRIRVFAYVRILFMRIHEKKYAAKLFCVFLIILN